MAASETVEAVLEHPAPEPVVEPKAQRTRPRPAVELSVPNLPRILGPGWAVEDPAGLVKVMRRFPALHAALTGRGAQIDALFGHPLLRRIRPGADGQTVEVDLEADLPAAEWAAARERVLRDWCLGLPADCRQRLVV